MQNPGNLFADDLGQRARASIDFLIAMGKTTATVSAEMQQDIVDAGIEAAELPDDFDQRHAVMERALQDSDAFGLVKLIGDWWGKYHGMIAIEAFEDSKDKILPELDRVEQSEGDAELVLHPERQLPEWWTKHWIHRTTGGWDGHAHMGYIHGEIIHPKIVASMFGDIFKQRREVTAKAPRENYRRILDMGASSGHSLVGLQQNYPDAQLVGIDLSARMLEQAYRMAKRNGWSWQLHQQDAAATEFEDESFDLVVSYALLHEVPAAEIRKIFQEAYRVLEPSGNILFSDVSRYDQMDKLKSWRADYSALYGGEPYWRESAQLDFGSLAREAGFADVQVVSEPPFGYPHYVIATKPVG